MNNGILSCYSPHIFWNCNINNLDIKKDRKIIIERVIERGNEEDEILMWKMYNYNIIKKIALNDLNLNKERLSYMSLILNVKESKFKCYKNILLYDILQANNNND